jgi:hypothetical protein
MNYDAKRRARFPCFSLEARVLKQYAMSIEFIA